jgi:hypothetical protein
MKKLLSLVVVMFVTLNSFGQQPLSITYTLPNNITITDTINALQDAGNVNFNTLTIPKNTTINFIKNELGHDLDMESVIEDPFSVYPLVIPNTYYSEESFLIRVTNSFNYIIIIVYDPTQTSLGTDEFKFDREMMKVFPSPAIDKATVSFIASDMNVPLVIYSMNGSIVFTDNEKRNVGALNEIQLDLSRFDSGVYIARAGKDSFRFIKQ